MGGMIWLSPCEKHHESLWKGKNGCHQDERADFNSLVGRWKGIWHVDIPYIRGKNCSKPCVMKCKERTERVGSLQTWHDSCPLHICLHFTLKCFVQCNLNTYQFFLIYILFKKEKRKMKVVLKATEAQTYTAINRGYQQNKNAAFWRGLSRSRAWLIWL